MAITNEDRIAKTPDLLKAGLAPLVDREMKSAPSSAPTARPPPGAPGPTPRPGDPASGSTSTPSAPPPARPTRWFGTVTLDGARVGRDAGQIAEEVLAGLPGADLTVTLDIQATIPDGVPDTVVRTVTENSRTLRFKAHGFERE